MVVDESTQDVGPHSKEPICSINQHLTPLVCAAERSQLTLRLMQSVESTKARQSSWIKGIKRLVKAHSLFLRLELY